MLEDWGLNYEMLTVLLILIFTIILFIIDIVRVDVVAIMVLIILGLTNLLSHEQLFSGFASEAAISLIGIMIISASLERSGIASKFANWLLQRGSHHTKKISLILMFASGFLASFMRSLGTVALFLPVINSITLRLNIAKSELLLPVAFCALLGGTMTMVGSSPLILLNTLLSNASQSVSVVFQPFELFAVFPIGCCLLLAGIIYFVLIGQKMLPVLLTKQYNHGTAKDRFFKTYDKGPDIFELEVLSNSNIINCTLKELELKLDISSSVIAIQNDKDCYFPPLRYLKIKHNAILAIIGEKDVIANFAEKYNLKLLPKLNIFADLLHSSNSGMCEAVLPPSSTFIGIEVNALHMRRSHQIHVLALRRGNTIYRGEELKKVILRSGDTLGMYCCWEVLTDFHDNPNFIVVTTEYPKAKINKGKIFPAITFFLLAVGLIILGKFPLPIGLLVCAAGMIGTGVLSIDEAYSAVSWKTVFLVAGLIPLGLVMQTTGTAEWLIKHSGIIDANLSNIVLQLGLVIVSTLFALVVSNVGATIMLVPIAIDLALSVNADPRLFALTVALGASSTFLIPTHQSNALVAGPGNYSVIDFLKIGGGLTLISWITIILGLFVLDKCISL